jgi:peptide/nickel transport system substrate-binding protein
MQYVMKEIKKRKGLSTLAIVAIAAVIIILVLAGVYFMLPALQKPTTIIIGTTDKIADLDPAQAYDFFTWEVLQNEAEGLMKYIPGGTDLTFGLAQSYNVSADGLVYVFNLKPNLKFNDGTPLNASDVKRSLDRVITIQGDPAWLVADFVQSVTVLNETAVQITLKTPVSYFTALLATPPSFVVSANYSNVHYDSDNKAGGCGPYRIVNWTRDQTLYLEANPYYYNTSQPLTKNIVIKFYSSATTMRLDLEAGNIDVAWKSINPVDLASLQANANLTVLAVPGPVIRYMVLNEFPSSAPINNPLVRQAIAVALNRTDICSSVYLNTQAPLYTMIPIGMWSHTDVFQTKFGVGPNMTLAQSLLQQAGYTTNNKAVIDFWYTPSHYGDLEADLAQKIKVQLENTGLITVNIHSAEWTTYQSNSRTDVMPVSLFGWYPDFIDPDDYSTPFWSWPANHWLGNSYNDSAMIALLANAQILTSQDARAAQYVIAQNMSATECFTIPIMQGQLTMAAKTGIGGIVLDPTSTFRYYLLYWK